MYNCQNVTATVYPPVAGAHTTTTYVFCFSCACSNSLFAKYLAYPASQSGLLTTCWAVSPYELMMTVSVSGLLAARAYASEKLMLQLS